MVHTVSQSFTSWWY